MVNYSKVILTEFGYDGSLMETFPVDQRVPRRLMYYLTTYVIPALYWNLLLRSVARFSTHCIILTCLEFSVTLVVEVF